MKCNYTYTYTALSGPHIQCLHGKKSNIIVIVKTANYFNLSGKTNILHNALNFVT